MPVSERTYERVALEDPEGKWELHRGELRRKPPMTTRHNQFERCPGFRLQQHPLEAFEVSTDTDRVRTPTGRTFIPDLVVIPRSLVKQAKRERPMLLETYAGPLPPPAPRLPAHAPGARVHAGRAGRRARPAQPERRGGVSQWLRTSPRCAPASSPAVPPSSRAAVAASAG